jgi:phosphoribosylamine--glycine ligase
MVAEGKRIVLLFIGDGEEECALIMKLKQNPKVSRILCMPDIPGKSRINKFATCIGKVDLTNIETLLNTAFIHEASLVVFGKGIPIPPDTVKEFQQFDLKIACPIEAESILDNLLIIGA